MPTEPDRMLNGDTKIIAHVGYPTTTFKSSMIYNPWFEKHGINAAVVPLGVKSEDFGARLSGDLPLHQFPRRADHHAAQGLGHRPHRRGLDRSESRGLVQRGAPEQDGRLIGDMFDGEGFVRGVARNGGSLAARGCSSSGRAASAPRSPPRRPPRAPPRSRSTTSTPSSMEALAERLKAELSAPQGLDSDRTTRAGSTSS